jgi:hypothetical protein
MEADPAALAEVDGCPAAAIRSAAEATRLVAVVGTPSSAEVEATPLAVEADTALEVVVATSAAGVATLAAEAAATSAAVVTAVVAGITGKPHRLIP